ncbi:MAG: Fe-S cluster assembly protein SufD [Candidatus Binatia bacterium]
MEVLRNVPQGANFFTSELARFRAGQSDNGQAWTGALREAAFSRFSELGAPTTKEEDWKYTNVSSIARIPFRPAPLETLGVGGDQLARSGLAWLAENRLVCVNGHFSPELSFLEKLPGEVKVGSLKSALGHEREIVEAHLGRHASYQKHSFVALNTAFMQDGVFVYVPKGTVIAKPIHLLFIATRTTDPIVAYPRNLIVLEENSQATILESYSALEEQVYFTNGVTEIVLGDHAVLDHTKLERESQNAFHIASLQVHQSRNATLFSHLVSTGGSLVRNEVNTVLDGEGGECILDGLFIVGGRQHVDNRTRIDHVQSHCSSRELYKGVIGGSAHGVFNGKIYVHPSAAKTDARQTNNNLLLSKSAAIDTKPQLEIYNNDVKCTHGSTIGQIDASALFYLRTRGLAENDARRLLTYAFASEVIGRVKMERVRLQLENWLLARFQGNSPAGDTE